jgi:hypothetical protein
MKSMKWWILLGCIALLSLGARLWVIPQLGGVSGGDAYNYLFIAKSITIGENPFTNTKRLPGYPILLTPIITAGTFDEEYVMRAMQAVAGIWGIWMVALLARSMKLPWQVAIVAATTLAFQKDYFWTSMRPEPYTLYTALLLTALYLFIEGYKQPSWKRHVLFGIFIGYAAFTRQEGFLAATVLGACSLCVEIRSYIHTRKMWASLKRLLVMYLPALLIISPFLINNTIAYGNPLYSPYLEGDRLQIVDSYLAFQDAAGATWGIIDSMWKPSWDQLERLDLTSDLFIASALGLLAWYCYMRISRKTSWIPSLCIAIASGAIALMYFFQDEKTFAMTLPIITSAWILVSIPLFIFETRWKGVLLVLMALSQIGIATWFHPFPKHYQQAYPIITLMVATILVANIPKKRIAHIIIPLTAALPFLLVGYMLYTHLNAAIDEGNEDSALDSVIYRASRYARDLAAPVGFDQAYLPARFYYDPGLLYFDDESAPISQRNEWIKTNGIKTVVVTNSTTTFKEPDPNWKVLKTFKAAGKHDFIFVSTVYAI